MAMFTLPPKALNAAFWPVSKAVLYNKYTFYLVAAKAETTFGGHAPILPPTRDAWISSPMSKMPRCKALYMPTAASMELRSGLACEYKQTVIKAFALGWCPKLQGAILL